MKRREVELDSHSWMDCLAAELFLNRWSFGLVFVTRNVCRVVPQQLILRTCLRDKKRLPSCSSTADPSDLSSWQETFAELFLNSWSFGLVFVTRNVCRVVPQQLILRTCLRDKKRLPSCSSTADPSDLSSWQETFAECTSCFVLAGFLLVVADGLFGFYCRSAGTSYS